ncbi:hypothetical protein Syun_016152 [Stephania yunnanensis]|uniref:Rab3 GTPase-activating protein catalytic subunit n=1 Tax=Stephania yunnanensis TaxID=152371 RepID=A0AAP0J5E1_9MAGN
MASSEKTKSATEDECPDDEEAACRLWMADGPKNLLVIAPLSASGVILDAPEATKLLSAVAVALSNSGSTWPAFVPIHDPSRKAYIGIQNMGTLLTRRFESDRIGSQVPEFSSVDFSTSLFKVYFTMRLTYQTPPYDDEDDAQESEPEVREAGGNPDAIPYNKIQWDDDCPWAEWYSAEDPVRGFQLIAVWSNKVVENSLEMAELENASSHEADIWILSPILSSNTNKVPEGKLVGFASQLRLLVNALDISFEGQFIEDFTSGIKAAHISVEPG